MTSLDEHMDSVLGRMLKHTQAIRRSVQAYASTQPQSIICKKHKLLRKIDWDKSVIESHRASKTILIYTPCPLCEALARARADGDWLMARGVPNELCDASFESFQIRNDGDKDLLECAKRYSQKLRGFLVLTGDYGVAKSFIAVCIMRVARTGLFITHAELMDWMSERYSGGKEDPVEACKSTKLLVLDDLGISRGGTDTIPVLHRILEHRHGRKLPTVITSNLDAKAIAELLGERMADRLRQSTFATRHVVGKSMRAEKRRDYFNDEER